MTFNFTGSVVTRLGPGEYTVVVNNIEAFKSRYTDPAIKLAGEYTGSLNSRGEPMTMTGPVGEPVHDIRYDSTWYPETATQGYSLVLKDPRSPRESWSEADAWKASAAVGGSPGTGELPEPPGGRQRPGDANQDGGLTITDPIATLAHLFLGPNVAGAPPCEGATILDGANKTLLDADGSGIVEITDPVYLLLFLFADGPAPVSGTSCIEIKGCPDACAAAQ